MKLGVVFPQTEIGADPAGVKEYAQAVEQMGFTHILTYDHVLGASLKNRPDWRGAYDENDMFHEPMVLFGYLAGLTQSLELVTGILILPQRQTALVAKQAAEVDVLSGGRLRLGVGIGWNQVEYEALGEDFHTRGRRMDEQIELLRLLWTEPVVDFKGKWDTIPEAGLNPLPVQRPIPIWIGASADAALERVGRLGDGWFPQMPPNDRAKEAIDKLREYTVQAGRKPEDVGIEARLSLKGLAEDGWREQLEGWRKLGATHVSVNTMGMGMKGVGAHIDTLRRFQEVVG